MQENSKNKNGGQGCLNTLLTLGIFITIGAGLVLWGWNILQTAKASAAWPTTDGRVTRSEVSHSTDADSGDSYSPEVTYQYQVAGVAHQNNVIKFGENAYSSRRKAEGIASGYPVNARVTVYYDPAQPERSVLEPGVTAGSYIVLGIGAFFILITLIIAVMMFFWRKKS